MPATQWGTSENGGLSMFLNFIQETVDLSTMIEYRDQKQRKIRLKTLQCFSILMLFDSGYAKPYTAEYAAM